MKSASLLGLLLSLLPLSAADTVAGSRPNIVVIIADDMAWDDCGAYGHPRIRTPHIDRLAREGMRFDRAFLTTSSCSPSRASILTGLYPHKTDAEQLHWPLPADKTLFVESLRQTGYWTASVGKWHLGEAMKDRFDLVQEADISGFQLPTGRDAKTTFQQRGTGEVKSGATGWVPVLSERPKDKPFFLWLAAIDPHRGYDTDIIDPPHKPEDVRVPPYLPDRPEVRADFALYYDEITRLDTYVGRVLAELDRQQIATNTLVLFMSDNGRPFPRDKTTLYDSGIRTPFIIRWPARVRPGTICPRLVSSLDIAPTMLELAGAPGLPHLDGKSFTTLLTHPNNRIRKFIHAERHWHDYEAFARAIRTERFKYIRNLYPDLPNTPPADAARSPTYRVMKRMEDLGQLNAPQLDCFLKPRPPEALYDLENDPHELKNLVGNKSYNWILSTFRREFTGWQLMTRDRYPAARTPDEFDRETGKPLPNRKRPRPSKQEMRGALNGPATREIKR